MPPYPRGDASFIVRIWWERQSDDQVGWRGQVVHVSTGQVAYFQSVADLVTFCEQWTGALLAESDSAVREIPPHEGENHG